MARIKRYLKWKPNDDRNGIFPKRTQCKYRQCLMEIDTDSVFWYESVIAIVKTIILLSIAWFDVVINCVWTAIIHRNSRYCFFPAQMFLLSAVDTITLYVFFEWLNLAWNSFHINKNLPESRNHWCSFSRLTFDDAAQQTDQLHRNMHYKKNTPKIFS